MITSLIPEDRPIVLYPALAKAIGVNSALIVQQVHYLTEVMAEQQMTECFWDGAWWVKRSFREWDSTFAWLSSSAIKKLFAQLLTLGILKSAKPAHDSPWDQTRWYRVDYDQLFLRLSMDTRVSDPESTNDTLLIEQNVDDDREQKVAALHTVNNLKNPISRGRPADERVLFGKSLTIQRGSMTERHVAGSDQMGIDTLPPVAKWILQHAQTQNPTLKGQMTRAQLERLTVTPVVIDTVSYGAPEQEYANAPEAFQSFLNALVDMPRYQRQKREGRAVSINFLIECVRGYHWQKGWLAYRPVPREDTPLQNAAEEARRGY